VWVWDASTGGELQECLIRSVDSVVFLSKGTQIGSGWEDDSVHAGCEHFAWYLADKKWIISSQRQHHLMWVPQEAELLQSLNILTISCSGFAAVDFHQSMIGVDWVHCYIP
jgi:hypothetical protein